MTEQRTRILAQLRTCRETKPHYFWGGVAAAAFSLLGMVAASAVVPERTDAFPQHQTVVRSLSLSPTAPQTEGREVFVREERVRRGETIGSLFNRLGIDDAEASAFLRESHQARPVFQQLRPGNTITARTTADGELVSVFFPLQTKDRILVIERGIDGFTAREKSMELEARLSMAAGEIKTSLFAATDEIGLPDGVALQLAEIFGGDIDFHRGLRRGDRFSLVYEMFYSQGQPQRSGRVVAAELIHQSKTYRAFFYREGDGEGSYYGPDGKSLRKAFLRSPLEFSRVTSGFAMRLHPILQEWRAHKGVDYGAPVGTRVRTTGDGVVEFAGRQNGFGNVVVIRHPGPYTTLYGHLSGFAPGIRNGARIGQGDVIGYVGMTGITTGPHLHYEFRINNQHQDPLTSALANVVPLPTQQIASFKANADLLAKRLDLLRSSELEVLN